jgi:hypothetical protein
MRIAALIITQDMPTNKKALATVEKLSLVKFIGLKCSPQLPRPSHSTNVSQPVLYMLSLSDVLPEHQPSFLSFSALGSASKETMCDVSSQQTHLTTLRSAS